jgi:hypothetical protein
LTDAERESALVAPEPAHDRSTARRVHARAGGPAKGERDDEHRKRGSERRDEQAEAATGQADGQDSALADPVCEEPPGEQREHGACVGRRDREAYLRERQIVFLLQRRREHRDAEEDRRVGGLRARPEREDRPPVPGHAVRA